MLRLLSDWFGTFGILVMTDIRYAVRLLLKTPGFTLLTTLVIAAGIGLSVYTFSILNVVQFKDLPFQNGDSLVRLTTSRNGALVGGRFNPHDFHEVRTQIDGLSEISAYSTFNVNVIGRDGARRYKATAAESNYFEITRTKPILGREFDLADTQVGAEPVAVIGYDFWQNQFDSDLSVLNQTLRVNGITHRIIGVMPEGYFFPRNTMIWLPLRQDVIHLERGKGSHVFGAVHIDDGYSVKDINRNLKLIMQRLEKRYPKTNSGLGAYVERYQGNPDDYVIFAAQLSAILVMILASLNIGNLLFSRAIERGKETAIRAALGAPRSRLISQVLWESIIICCIGGFISLLVVAWCLEITQEIFLTFTNPPFWWKFSVDAFTIKILLIFIVGAIVVTGLLPAWRNSSGDFNAVLRDGTRGALGKKAGRLSRLLVISEIFISIFSLITAGMLVISSYKEAHANVGATVENRLLATVFMSQSDYDSEQKQAQFAKNLQSRLENTAGIGGVVLTTAIPGDFTATPAIAIEGKEYNREGTYPRVNYVRLTSGSLRNLGIELKEGRYFNSGDNSLDKSTIIVSDSFSQRYFPNESALGKRVRIVEYEGEELRWLTIVGVVKHTLFGKRYGDDAKRGSIFRPISQAPSRGLVILVQMIADRPAVESILRAKLSSIDPDLPAYGVETYTERLSRHNAEPEFISTMFLLSGFVTLLFAASGIYGVTSKSIIERTREIGVKRALGAMEQCIRKEYLMIGVKQLLWGSIPGFLFGCGMGFVISKTEAAAFSDLLVVSIPLIVIISSVVLFSTWLPTQRALRISPGEALRYE